MKICLLLAWSCAFFTKNILASPPGPIHAPLDIISLDDITPEERREIAYFEQKLGRPKRSGSGSGDILVALKNAIGQGIKKKVGQIARASASASAHFSSSSSGSGKYSHHPPEHVPESYDHKSLDFWSLKKSILNTLLQAVKAIKGGVIAVKGQLIKGSGKLISAKGKLISYKGDAITQLGKNIATSAVLVPYHGHHSSGHGYGSSDSHYSAPSAPEEIYHGSPSAPGPDYDHEYHVPDHYPPPHHEGADGLLVVKKIPSHLHHYQEDVPAFKPVEPSGPSFGTIVGKFFSASSSFDPHQPEPFGNTASAGTYESHHSDSHYHHHDQRQNELAPTEVSGLVTLGEKHEIEQHKPPTTSYGTPFEQAPSYLNQDFGDFSVSASKNVPKFIKVDKSKKNNPSPTSNSLPLTDTSDKTNPEQSMKNLGLSVPGYNPNFQALPSESQSTGSSNGEPNVQQVNPTSSQVQFQNSFYDPKVSANSPNSGQIHFQNSFYEPKVTENSPSSSQVQFQNSFLYPTVSMNSPSSSQISNFESDSANLPNIADYPDGFPPSNTMASDAEGQTAYFDTRNQAEWPQKPVSSPPIFEMPFSSPSPYLESPAMENVFLPTPNVVQVPTKHSYSGSSRNRYRASKRPTSIYTSKGLSHYRKTPKTNPNVKIVKSVSYQLGPHGPKRLT